MIDSYYSPMYVRSAVSLAFIQDIVCYHVQCAFDEQMTNLIS